MPLKDIFKLSFWDVPRLTLVVGFLSLIAMIVLSTHQPAFLFPEKISYNSDIQLMRTSLTQQDLLFLESFKESSVKDKIEQFDVSNFNDKEKYVYFKLADIDNPNTNRDILVTFTDPNNIVRFSSSQISENQINQKNLSNLGLQNFSVKTYEKIRIPDLNNYNLDNIGGTWHLNIYVFNPRDELTLVASKPTEFSIFSVNNPNPFQSIMIIIAGIVISILSVIIVPFITQKDSKTKADTTKADTTKADTTKADTTKADTTKADTTKADTTKADTTKENLYEKTSNLINPSRLESLEGLVVDVNYGLIKRCPECEKLIMIGRSVCPTHGKIKGNYDIYLESRLYDGILEHILLIKRPVLEKYFKISVDSCIAMAADRLDPTVVGNLFSRRMIGKWFSVKGIYSPDGFDVESMEMNDQYSHESALVLYDRWKSG